MTCAELPPSVQSALIQSPTWADLIDYAWPEIKVSLVCCKSYQCHIRQFRERWGALPCAELNHRTIAMWVAEIRKNRSDGTLRHKVAALRRLIAIGLRDEFLTADPLAKVKIPTANFHRTGWVSESEEMLLLADMGRAYGSLARFAICTGLRLGEQMALVRSDFDFNAKAVTVRLGKTMRTRVVPLNSSAVLIAQEWMAAHTHQLVFLPQYETRRDLAGIRCSKHLRRAAERSKIGRAIWWRDLRHTFASRLVQRGVSLFVVQKLLGHTNPLMSVRYADAGTSPLRDAVHLLDSAQEPWEGLEE